MTAASKRPYSVMSASVSLEDELRDYLKILNTRDNFLPLKRCTDLEKGKE